MIQAWLALFTGIILIMAAKLRLNAQGIELAVARAQLPLRELKMASNLDGLFPEERSYPEVSDAAAAFQASTSPQGEAQ